MSKEIIENNEDDLTNSQKDRLNKQLVLESSILGTVDKFVNELAKDDDITILAESYIKDRLMSDDEEEKLTANQVIKLIELRQTFKTNKMNILANIMKSNEKQEINIPIDFGNNKVDPSEVKEALKNMEELKKLKKIADSLEETE